MSRLIDADNTKIEIANYLLQCVDAGKVVVDIVEVQKGIFNIINNQPTAYDVEKVVEEVQNVRLPLASQKARIIGIVRKGGVE